MKQCAPFLDYGNLWTVRIDSKLALLYFQTRATSPVEDITALVELVRGRYGQQLFQVISRKATLDDLLNLDRTSGA